MKRAMLIVILVAAAAPRPLLAGTYARLQAPVQAIDCATGAVTLLGLRVRFVPAANCAELHTGVIAEAILELPTTTELRAKQVNARGDRESVLIEAPLQSIDHERGTITTLGVAVDAKNAVIDGDGLLDSLRVGEGIVVIIRPASH